MRPETKQSSKKQSAPSEPAAASDPHVFTALGADRTAISRRLTGLPSGTPRIDDFSADALLGALDRGAAPIVVLPQAALSLARALAGGAAPSDALNDWQRGVTAILALQGRNRRRILLVEERYLLRVSDDIPPRLSERLALQDNPPTEADPIDPFCLCLATVTLLASGQAGKLAAELEASSLSLGDTPPDIGDIDTVFTEARTRASDRKDLQQQLDRLTETAAAHETALAAAATRETDLAGERNLRQAQLEQLKTELGTAATREADLQDRIAVLKREATARQKDADDTLAAARKEADDLRLALEQSHNRETQQGQDFARERNLLQDHLGQIQTELVAAVARETELQGQVTVLEQRRATEQAAARQAADESRAALDAIRKDASELRHKLGQSRTQEQQHGKALAAAIARETTLKQDCDLHRTHLERLQDELTAAVARETEGQGRIAAAEQHAADQQKELGKLRKALALAEKRQAHTHGDTTALEDRILTQFNQIKRLGRDLAHSKTQQAAAEAEAQQARDREQQLSQRLAYIEAEHSKVLMSQSWNVTKPLRAVNQVLGKSSGKKK